MIMMGKIYNYEKHVGDMLNMNRYECENSNKSIWFPSLQISVDMEQYLIVSPLEIFKNLPTDEEYLNTYKK